MVRRFTGPQVPQQSVERILRNAVRGPSAGIYIGQYTRQDAAWADESRWPVPFWHIDTAMAALLILLTDKMADAGAQASSSSWSASPR